MSYKDDFLYSNTVLSLVNRISSVTIILFFFCLVNYTITNYEKHSRQLYISYKDSKSDCITLNNHMRSNGGSSFVS